MMISYKTKDFITIQIYFNQKGFNYTCARKFLPAKLGSKTKVLIGGEAPII